MGASESSEGSKDENSNNELGQSRGRDPSNELLQCGWCGASSSIKLVQQVEIDDLEVKGSKIKKVKQSCGRCGAVYNLKDLTPNIEFITFVPFKALNNNNNHTDPLSNDNQTIQLIYSHYKLNQPHSSISEVPTNVNNNNNDNESIVHSSAFSNHHDNNLNSNKNELNSDSNDNNNNTNKSDSKQEVNNDKIVYLGSLINIEGGFSFKISQCSPPFGLISSETKIRIDRHYLITPPHLNHALHSSRPSNFQTLFFDKSNIISRIHLVPTLTSLHSNNNNSNSESNPSDGYIVTTPGPPSSTHLFNNFIKPFFKQAINPNTMNNNKIHVNQGSSLIIFGVEFMVIGCEPYDGFIGPSTEFFTDGAPIIDLTRIHILPIYESLPNNEKNISSELMFKKYLLPFFYGRRTLIVPNQRLNIDGVDFIVIALEPLAGGVVTLQTKLYCDGEPIKYCDLLETQQQNDISLAAHLQFQNNFIPDQQFIHRSSRMELRNRLFLILRSMPLNDPNRPTVERLYNQLTILPYVPGARIEASFVQLLRELENFNYLENTAGAGATQIESLPTRFFKPKKTLNQNHSPSPSSASVSGSGDSTNNKDANNDADLNTCRVCLTAYEEDEEIRTLPCLHFYHKECIDPWLIKSRLCPICKHPIC